MWFGATVSARSVKLISLKTTERDSWWVELREEITKHALSMNCTHIIGYREVVSIYEDVMMLNVFGTAVKIKEIHHRKDMFKQNPLRLRTPIEYSPTLDPVQLSKSIST